MDHCRRVAPISRWTTRRRRAHGDARRNPAGRRCGTSIQSRDRIWITWCDQVGVHRDTIATLRRSLERAADGACRLSDGSPATTLTSTSIETPRGRITAIRQRREGDAMPPVGESDMGLFSLSPEAYFKWLPRFGAEAGRSSATRERNFLPFMPWMAQHGHRVVTFPCTNEMEALGINTPEDRLRMEQYLRGAGSNVKRLSIVIPAYNEERFIGTLLERIRAVDLRPHGFEKEIIVVDDCSRDGTAEAVERIPDVILCRHERNSGQRQGGSDRDRARHRRLRDDSGRRSRIRPAGLRADGARAAVGPRGCRVRKPLHARALRQQACRNSRGPHISAAAASVLRR